VANCGGSVERRDLAACFDPDQALLGNYPERAAARAGLEAAFAADRREYELSLSIWGDRRDYPYDQTSRPGSSLVVQVNFACDHDVLYYSYLRKDDRHELEASWHPVRDAGRPTMAWVRVDIQGDEALIEEVQSDWFRLVARRLRWLEARRPRSRHCQNHRDYAVELAKRYGGDWAEASLFAALRLLVDELGVKRVFMHQPDAGARLKNIEGGLPPRSIYTSLPKRFGFAPTNDVPEMLVKRRRKHLCKLRKIAEPLFWSFVPKAI